jgi:hypothetical protein
MQLGLDALKKPRPKPAIKSLQSVSKRLSFASTIDYVACKGYTCGSSNISKGKEISFGKNPVLEDVGSSGQTHWTVSEPSIPFGTIGNFPIRQQCPERFNNQVRPIKIVAAEDNVTILKPESGQDRVSDNNGLDDVVNDISFRFWKCSKCLSMSHTHVQCTNKIRCRSCFHYGHEEKSCFNKIGHKCGQWIPKRVRDASPNLDMPSLPLAGSASNNDQVILQSNPPLLLPPPPPPPPEPELDPLHQSSSMAVFELDPNPWLPWGHQVIDGGGTRLPRTYYNPSSDPPHQERDLCIAIVEPALPAMHEGLWRDRVRDFLVN